MTLSYSKCVIRVQELVWNEWNIDHIKKHHVTQQEVADACEHLITHEKAKQGRYALFGRTGTRILTIIVRRVKPKTYRVVTARDAAKKERRKVYEKEKGIS